MDIFFPIIIIVIIVLIFICGYFIGAISSLTSLKKKIGKLIGKNNYV